MGVRGLYTFIRSVPTGYIPVDIEDEIRKFKSTQSSNFPEVVLVIDAKSLLYPLATMDLAGFFCGGQYPYICDKLETFFTKLKNLGLTLVFYYDGPVHYPSNAEKKARRYEETVKIMDDVDQGLSIETLVERCGEQIPLNSYYPLKHIVKKYGKIVVCMTPDIDQDLATYANKVRAMAVLSDDTDFLIYEGSWKYWSSKAIDFDKLTTMGYNKEALLQQLDLDYKKMPLLATLAGNDIIQYDEVKKFINGLGSRDRRMLNLAQFVRRQSENFHLDAEKRKILATVFGKAGVKRELITRFQQSLDSYTVRTAENLKPSSDPSVAVLLAQDAEFPYQPTAKNLNPSNDLNLAKLLAQDTGFSYQVWVGNTIEISCSVFLDMRDKKFGALLPELVIPTLARQAGVILYRREPQPGAAWSTILLRFKPSHASSFTHQVLPVDFPDDIDPPSMSELLCDEPETRAELFDVKCRLFCWIASDTLDHRHLKSVPEPLQVTVVTLYHLMEKKVIELFEADLLLKVAYDVVYKTYDFKQSVYPDTLNSRPFRLAFLYQQLYNNFSKAFQRVGLGTTEYMDYPQFDGVLFHNRYADWKKKRGGDVKEIAKYRIHLYSN